jgi:hypothetical protein
MLHFIFHCIFINYATPLFLPIAIDAITNLIIALTIIWWLVDDYVTQSTEFTATVKESNMGKKSFSLTTVKSALTNNLCQTWHEWLEVIKKLSNKEKNKTKKSQPRRRSLFFWLQVPIRCIGWLAIPPWACHSNQSKRLALVELRPTCNTVLRLDEQHQCHPPIQPCPHTTIEAKWKETLAWVTRLGGSCETCFH